MKKRASTAGLLSGVEGQGSCEDRVEHPRFKIPGCLAILS
jgi:hypothetical protein